MLIIILFSIKNISQNINVNKNFRYGIFFVLLIVLVGLSPDYYLHHLLNITSKEIRYRTIYSPKHADMYYFQEDYKTPAEVINKNMNSSDIIVTTQTPIEYYLNRLDYDYVNYKFDEFPIISRLNGKKEVWTNANLIYREKDLFQLLDHSNSTIWLTDFSKKRYGVSPTEMKINKEFKRYLYYVNIDSTINVFKIPPTK